MKTYVITVFDKSGEKLFEESFEAKDDKEAKEIGQRRLAEENYSEHTSRVTRSSGGLVHFHH
ncbi:YhzD family protein [Anaerobacillus sp. MEB173]|uniref:YhzD family protein n=1 Tax=Anaerobacillus sp. MEB173 TaxID=3383345 RepID=UPI003F9161F3